MGKTVAGLGLATVAGGREVRKMGVAAATWLSDSNMMRLQDDGGGLAVLEIKGGGWVAAFGRAAGYKKRVARAWVVAIEKGVAAWFVAMIEAEGEGCGNVKQGMQRQ
ncbi:hypothetical protein B296_00024340 [Ensete ventricosum]|uniref:Uncharacterized protein n=1 Tax=Ensete ventricosum TaxID=4639 RepID=A0A427AV32_ENSVE|nr:hypothetical protein B296_00024340 [Ensete ventricosum]